MKPIKGFLIDPRSREVRPVEYSGKDTLSWAQSLVGGRIERATQLDCGDDVYVNEEGLLEQTPDSRWFFIRGAHQPFIGSGLVVGCDERYSMAPAQVTLEELRRLVVFMDMADVSNWVRFGILPEKE